MKYGIQYQELTPYSPAWYVLKESYPSEEEAMRAIRELMACGGRWVERAYRVGPFQPTEITHPELVRLAERLQDEDAMGARWFGEDGEEAVLSEENVIAAAVPGGPVRIGWLRGRRIGEVVRELLAGDHQAAAQERERVAAQEAYQRAMGQERERVAKQERERAAAFEAQERTAAQERERVAKEERERVAALEAQQRAEAQERERVARQERERAALEAQQRAAQERERIAQQERERAAALEAQWRAEAQERERVAQQERERATLEAQHRAVQERERLAQQERDRAALEARQRAVEERERAAALEARQRAAQERERLAQQERDRVALEARQRAVEERERLAQQERDRAALEAQRRTAQERERVAQQERDRVAREAQQRAAQERERLAQQGRDRAVGLQRQGGSSPVRFVRLSDTQRSAAAVEPPVSVERVTQAAQLGGDRELVALATLLRCGPWREGIRASDLLTTDQLPAGAPRALRELVGRGTLTVRALGNALKRVQDKRIEGIPRKVTRTIDNHGFALWQVVDDLSETSAASDRPSNAALLRGALTGMGYGAAEATYAISALRAQIDTEPIATLLREALAVLAQRPVPGGKPKCR